MLAVHCVSKAENLGSCIATSLIYFLYLISLPWFCISIILWPKYENFSKGMKTEIRFQSRLSWCTLWMALVGRGGGAVGIIHPENLELYIRTKLIFWRYNFLFDVCNFYLYCRILSWTMRTLEVLLGIKLLQELPSKPSASYWLTKVKKVL